MLRVNGTVRPFHFPSRSGTPWTVIILTSETKTFGISEEDYRHSENLNSPIPFYSYVLTCHLSRRDQPNVNHDVSVDPVIKEVLYKRGCLVILCNTLPGIYEIFGDGRQDFLPTDERERTRCKDRKVGSRPDPVPSHPEGSFVKGDLRTRKTSVYTGTTGGTMRTSC